MESQPIIVESVFDAPVQKVWNAITDKQEMKEWYFDLAEFKAEPGFEFNFVGGTEEHQYLHLCEVKEVIRERKISYTWRYENDPGESLVTWELSPEGDKTRLVLKHEGVETFASDNPDFDRKNFVQGWNDIVLNSLKNYLAK